MKTTIRHSMLVAAMAGLGALTACDTDKDHGHNGDEVYLINSITIAPTGYELPDGSICLEYGQTLQLSYTISPDSAGNKRIAWSTNDATIADVSQSGQITAGNHEGNTIVYAKPEIGFGAAAATPSLNVKVVEHTVDIASLSLSSDNAEDGEASATVLAGETRQLSVTALPAGHTFSNYAWSSSNEQVATVDESGFVTTIAQGSATITVTSKDRGGASASFAFDVKPSVQPTSVAFANTGALQALPYGTSVNLNDLVTLTPADATFALINWKSSDESIVTVDKKGYLHTHITITTSLFKMTGHSVTLTATGKDGKALGIVEVTTDGGYFIHNFADGLSPFMFTSAKPNMSYSLAGDHIHVVLGTQSATDSRQDLTVANTGNNGGFMLSTKKYKYFAMKFRRPYYYDAATGTYSRHVPGKNGNKLAFNLTPTTGSNVGHWEGFQQLDLATCTLVNEVWDGKEKIYVWTLDKHDNLVNATDAATGLVDIRNADIVVADVKAEQEKSYDIYWIGTFASLEEIKQYAETH